MTFDRILQYYRGEGASRQITRWFTTVSRVMKNKNDNDVDEGLIVG